MWFLDEKGEIPRTDSPQGVWCVYGGQAGSEGKGAVAGFLANQYRWGAVACNFGPNAGHTWIGDHTVLTRLLPIGLIADAQHVCLGAGSAIDVDLLMQEVEHFDSLGYEVSKRLSIHPRAAVVTQSAIDWEIENLSRIASTMKGSGRARAEKIARSPGAVLAADEPRLKQWIADVPTILNNVVNQGLGVLAEGAQGFGLDINLGYSYPFCSSTQATPTGILAELGLSGHLLARSIAVIRPYPIRVGNIVEDGKLVGESGPMGSSETDWKSVAAAAGLQEFEEKTTVTKRVRRVFEPDFDALARMSKHTRPTDVVLNFADQIDGSVYGKTHEELVKAPPASKIAAFIHQVENAMTRSTKHVKVAAYRTGPHNDHIMNYYL